MVLLYFIVLNLIANIHFVGGGVFVVVFFVFFVCFFMGECLFIFMGVFAVSFLKQFFVGLLVQYFALPF